MRGKKKKIAVRVKDIDSLYSSLILDLIIGARLGYVIFYNLSNYLKNPLEIFAVWHGGMSFHGGLIGSIVAGILFCKKLKIDFWQIADIVIVTAPIGLGLGRLGNFINGELYGRVQMSRRQWYFLTVVLCHAIHHSFMSFCLKASPSLPSSGFSRIEI